MLAWPPQSSSRTSSLSFTLWIPDKYLFSTSPWHPKCAANPIPLSNFYYYINIFFLVCSCKTSFDTYFDHLIWRNLCKYRFIMVCSLCIFNCVSLHVSQAYNNTDLCLYWKSFFFLVEIYIFLFISKHDKCVNALFAFFIL